MRAHLGHGDDPLLTAGPIAERYGDFAAFLGDPVADEVAWKALRMSETSGRPLGTEQWIEALEVQSGRTLKPQKRGPKPRQAEELSGFSKLAP